MVTEGYQKTMYVSYALASLRNPLPSRPDDFASLRFALGLAPEDGQITKLPTKIPCPHRRQGILKSR
jgi:hypothetical protein